MHIAHGFGSRQCTPPRLHTIYRGRKEITDPAFVRVACGQLHLQIEPRGLVLVSGHPGHRRATRCTDFAQRPGFELAILEPGNGVVCFKNFVVAADTITREVQLHFGWKCRTTDDDLRCRGFKTVPGKIVRR